MADDVWMTSAEFVAIKIALGLSSAELARALRMTAESGPRSIQKMEHGEKPVTGPVSLLMEAFRDGLIAYDPR